MKDQNDNDNIHEGDDAQRRRDMTLHVRVQLSGTLDAAGRPTVTAVYEQGDSDPPGKGVVAANGDIDLNLMDFDEALYNLRTLITFSLSGHIRSPEGKPLDFGFPADPDDAIEVKRDGRCSCRGMMPQSGPDPLTLVLEDENRDGRTHEYQLSVHVHGAGTAVAGPATCVLDPLIVNRQR